MKTAFALALCLATSAIAQTPNPNAEVLAAGVLVAIRPRPIRDSVPPADPQIPAEAPAEMGQQLT